MDAPSQPTGPVAPPSASHAASVPLGFLLHAVKSRLWYRRELRVYVHALDDLSQVPRFDIFRRDRLDDLRYYERSSKEQAPAHLYRKAAEERRAQGFHLYTFVQSGRLLHYGWLIERQTRGEDGWVEQVYFPPSETAVLFDHFTHPSARGRGLYTQALCSLLHEARDLARARQAYVTVFGCNGPSRHVIEKLGFQHEGSLYKEKKLLWCTRYAMAGRGEFRTALL